MIQEVATEREAQIEGAKNLYRYNRGDLFNLAVWVGLVLLAVVGSFLIGHLFVHHVSPCGTIGCHLHPTQVKAPYLKGFPIYHPPS